MSEQPVLSVQGLSGGYSMNRPVLHDVTFQVEPGEMVGLIGLNGAGKSTTMKHILGLMNPQKGSIQVQGKSRAEHSEAYHGALAFVPESPPLYEEMTVREHLEFTARPMAYPVKIMSRVRAAVQDVPHGREDGQPVHAFIQGYAPKVMIMCAFVARPSLYIIDEPFLGLDPLGIRSSLDFMLELKASGASVLLSSHILHD